MSNVAIVGEQEGVVVKIVGGRANAGFHNPSRALFDEIVNGGNPRRRTTRTTDAEIPSAWYGSTNPLTQDQTTGPIPNLEDLIRSQLTGRQRSYSRQSMRTAVDSFSRRMGPVTLRHLFIGQDQESLDPMNRDVAQVLSEMESDNTIPADMFEEVDISYNARENNRVQMICKFVPCQRGEEAIYVAFEL